MTAGAAHANLMVNGDFSSPNDGGGYSQTAGIPGWFSLGRDGHGADTIEVGASPIYGLPCVSSNCQNLELNSNTYGFVGQFVGGLSVNRTYQLSWDYGGRPGGGSQVALVFIYDPHTSKSTNLALDFGSIGTWSYNRVDFKATNPGEFIFLYGLPPSVIGLPTGNPSYGNEFTNFNLRGVPEPTTWATMLLGVFGLGAAARASRRKVRAAV